MAEKNYAIQDAEVQQVFLFNVNFPERRFVKVRWAPQASFPNPPCLKALAVSRSHSNPIQHMPQEYHHL